MAGAATKRRGARVVSTGTQPSRGQSEPPTIPPETPDDQLPFAVEDDLPDDTYVRTALPMFGRSVAVRLLATPEVALLEMLPDLAGWAEFAAKQAEGEQVTKESTQEEKVKAAAQWIMYQARVAHLALISTAARQTFDGGGIPAEEECPDCSFTHIGSLWRVSKTRKLNSADLNVIMNAALSSQVLGWQRPFSGPSTDSGTSPSATSGESTPEPTSSETATG